MHNTRHGSLGLGIVSLLSLVACNDGQLKTLGEIETAAGGSAGAASSLEQSGGGVSDGSASESTAGAQTTSGAGTGGSLSNGVGGSLASAGDGVGGLASNAGTAGVNSVDDGIDACSNDTWTATATVVCNPLGADGQCGGLDQPAPQTPAQAIDGDPTTRYTTGWHHVFTGKEEFTVAFPSSVTISGVSLDPGHYTDYPIAYALEFSTDGLTFVSFSPPITGQGTPDPNPPINCTYGFNGSCAIAIPFPPTAMKALKIKQIGYLENAGPDEYGNWWSIAELKTIACKEN